MNKARRLFLLGGAAGLAALMSGCTTPAIEAGHTYPESVSSLLISKDKQKIVFIGTNYHYVFDAPVDLVKTLELPFHSKVSGTLSSFHVDKKGAVTGVYSLQIEKNGLPEQDLEDAISAGFKPDSSGQLALAAKISGTRYHSGDFEKNAVARKLNKTYAIVVTYEPSIGERAADTLITPIIVSSEGVFFLFGLVLSPVLIPLGFSKISESCFPYCMTPTSK